MPVIHEYVDQDDFYILAVPYGLDTPVTYQVREGATNLFRNMDLTDGDRISWSFLRPLLAINQIYTQQSGVTDSGELADGLTNLSEEEQDVAISYFEQYFDLTDSELDELRNLASGAINQFTPETKKKLDAQLNSDLSDEPTDEMNVQSTKLNTHIGNEKELKKYLIELLDLSGKEIGKLNYLINGDLIHISPGLGNELEDRLVQAEELSKNDVRRSKLFDIVESLLIDEFDEQDMLKLSLRGVPGSFGDIGQANYEYYGDLHRLYNLSKSQAQHAKQILKEWGADDVEEDEYTNGIWITFALLNDTHHTDADTVVDNIIRVLEEIHDADLNDINRAHLTSVEGYLGPDGTRGIIKPGWDDRTLDL